MIKSMTGFGAADGEVGGAHVSVEIRSVNHRFFNPSIKLPQELTKWEGEVREAMRRGIARGHVSLTARVERKQSDAVHIDEERFVAYLQQARALHEKYQLGPVDPAPLLPLPHVIATS